MFLNHFIVRKFFFFCYLFPHVASVCLSCCSLRVASTASVCLSSAGGERVGRRIVGVGVGAPPAAAAAPPHRPRRHRALRVELHALRPLPHERAGLRRPREPHAPPAPVPGGARRQRAARGAARTEPRRLVVFRI